MPTVDHKFIRNFRQVTYAHDKFMRHFTPIRRRIASFKEQIPRYLTVLDSFIFLGIKFISDNLLVI